MLPMRLLAAEWQSDLSVDEIAAKYGTHKSTIYNLARRYSLPHRPREEKPDVESPSREEIELRAAEVRSRWSEKERENRIVGRVRQTRWTPPSFTRDQIVSGR